MKDKQIHDVVDSMLSGLEISAEEKDTLLRNTISGKSMGRKGFPGKIALTLVFALVLSSLLANAVGIPMLSVLRKWTDDVYAVRINMQKPMPGVFTAEKQPEIVSEVWGGNIADIMFDLNACGNIPRWIPERFVLTREPNITLDELFGNEIICNYKADDGSEMAISIRTLPVEGNYSSTSLLQHDNTENEIWIYNDIEYILLKNYQYHSLNWQENNCSVSIWGEFTRDEALKMVKSIYE